MINSINSQSYAVQQTRSNVGNVEQTTVNSPKEPENVNSSDARKGAISFIESATPEELEGRVNSLVGRMPSAAMINLREIMNSDNGDEVVERINRLSVQIEQESRSVLNQEQDLISQGRAEGKSDKDILMSIVKLQDAQSDVYKLAMHWGNEGLGSPNTYAKLVELTPTYVNYYA